MPFRTYCDWCGAYIDRTNDDYAEMPVTIHHPGGRSTLDARWAEETKITRFFCASPKEDLDRGGRNRAGLVPEETFDSCYDRAIAAITGTKLTDPGMGLEWRLMPVADGASAPPRPEDPAPDDDTWIGELEIGVRAYNALDRAGIRTVGKVRAELAKHMDLRQVPGIGSKCASEIAAALIKFEVRVERQVA